MPDRIELLRSKNTIEGSCNFCSRHREPGQMETKPHAVTVITSSRGGGIAPRACDFCLRDLVTALALQGLPEAT